MSLRVCRSTVNSAISYTLCEQLHFSVQAVFSFFLIVCELGLISAFEILCLRISVRAVSIVSPPILCEQLYSVCK